MGQRSGHPFETGGPADEERALWQEWRDTKSQTARRKLVSMHADYVRIVAATYYAKRYHDEIEYAEYAQLAYMGLLEAVERYDPALEVQFRTFAARRMHGAILDGIERLTEKQQQIAALRRLKAQRRQSLAGDKVGQTVQPGIATPQQVLEFVAQVGVGLALAWLLEGTGMIDDGEKSQTLQFYRGMELRQLRERLLASVQALPLQQRKVISAHYLQEMPFESIADMLALSRGRVSQIHKQALMALRTALHSPPRLQASY